MLELNEGLKNILNEKKGVTGNTAATTDCIVELISDCIAESEPYINKNNTDYPGTNRPSYIKYRNYRTYEERRVDEERNCIDFIYLFNLPETAIISDWMDDRTEIVIDCRYYLSAEDLFSDPNHGGAIFSSYKIENKKSVGKLYVIICFTSIVSMKQYCNQHNIVINFIEICYFYRIYFIVLRTIGVLHTCNPYPLISNVSKAFGTAFLKMFSDPLTSALIR